MIRIDHLTKCFGRFRAVHDLSLCVQAGESVALWGSNGAGKTTIIRCVLGLYSFCGTIHVNGIDVRSRGKMARAQIGYVPQELGFYDDVLVHGAIGYFARLKGVDAFNAHAVLAPVGLSGHENKRIRELSGGMKQRLALALALIGNPPVLVLDEVTASLDVMGRQELVQVLRDLRAAGRSILFASHRPDEIAVLSDRVIRLRSGEIDSECTPSSLAEHKHKTIKITLATDVLARAACILRASGIRLTVHAGSCCILIPIERLNRAHPIQLLTRADIDVDDFDLIEVPSVSAVEQPHVD